MAEEVQSLLREIAGIDQAAATTVALVTSETSGSDLVGRTLEPLGDMPRSKSSSCDVGVVVAQMGLEPIMCALEHADVVLCGRAYDPAVFAAEPVRRGFPAAMALHAAKVLECGAIATVPGSGSDCLVAELTMDGEARVWAPNIQRRATPLSVAAHTLYEKSHPHLFGLPGGVLNTRSTTFTQDGQVVKMRGTTLSRTPATVKLEGAVVRGARSVRLALLPEGHAESVGFVYGLDGVEARVLADGEQELGLLVSVKGMNLERNRSHLALLRATLLHWGFEGRKATAGNLAFPFSPSDLNVVGGSSDDNEVLTVCGTRDPAFIENFESILKNVDAYVRTLSPSEDLTVRFLPCGLHDMPRLEVIEAVADTHALAEAALPAAAWPEPKEQWVCSGGMAADFTLQHLVDVDDEFMRKLFQITLVGNESPIEARLMEWGSDCVGKDVAYAEWSSSKKPAGGKAVGQCLGAVAHVVRSKNAGVNEITYDLIFQDVEKYTIAKRSPSLDEASVGELLGRRVLGVFCDDTSLAMKITCDRGLLVGSQGDRDVYGAQQHRRLLEVIL